MTTDFERLQAVIDTIAMSEEDRRFVKASLWTAGEVPAVASQSQYEAYGKLAEQLSAPLPSGDDPGFPAAYARWARTRDGLLSISYTARMIEWEDRQEADSELPRR